MIHEMISMDLFTCLCLKDNLGLSSINCHIHAITGNYSASLRVLANSLRLISAMTENLSQQENFSGRVKLFTTSRVDKPLFEVCLLTVTNAINNVSTCSVLFVSMTGLFPVRRKTYF